MSIDLDSSLVLRGVSSAEVTEASEVNGCKNSWGKCGVAGGVGCVGRKYGDGAHAATRFPLLAGIDPVDKKLEDLDVLCVGRNIVQYGHHCLLEVLAHALFKSILFGHIVEVTFPYDTGEFGMVGGKVPHFLTELMEFAAGGADGMWVLKSCIE